MAKKFIKFIAVLLAVFLNINSVQAGSFKKFLKKALKESTTSKNKTKTEPASKSKPTPKAESNLKSASKASTNSSQTQPTSQASSIKPVPANSNNNNSSAATSNIVSLGSGKFNATNYSSVPGTINSPISACSISNSGKNLIIALPNGVKLEMVYCPEGSFIKGCPKEEIGGEDGFVYRPQETLIRQHFYIGKYEVTQAQYKAVIGSNPSKFQGDNLPVECTSFEDAKKFCEKLNTLCASSIPSGYKFDLPSDAHWEYACRAGTNTPLYSGKALINGYKEDPNLNPLAWYDSNSGGKTHPVGQKTPNSWGLYDMYGNVKEWTRYWRGYNSNIGVVTDNVTDSNQKMTRGGCFSDWSACCRSAYRDMQSSQTKNWDSAINQYTNEQAAKSGFRLALVPNDM